MILDLSQSTINNKHSSYRLFVLLSILHTLLSILFARLNTEYRLLVTVDHVVLPCRSLSAIGRRQLKFLPSAE